MRKNSIPGDILRTMRRVDNQPMEVKFERSSTAEDTVTVTLSRAKYNNIMKSNVFTAPNIKSGFYIVDSKARTATLVYPMDVKKEDVLIKVNDFAFKVMQPWGGFRYA